MAIRYIGIITVLFILILPVLTLAGALSIDQMKWYMLIGSILWFILAPFWIKNK